MTTCNRTERIRVTERKQGRLIAASDFITDKRRTAHRMKIEITTTETVGHQIRELARSKKIRMCHLCEQIGIKQATFTKMIKRNPKSIEIMIKMFEVLNGPES